MGLFKFKSSGGSKGSNKPHTAADQTSMFQPFSMSKRLSMINEEVTGSDDDISLEGGDRRRIISRGANGRNKNGTSSRAKMRFQKLVEWGDDESDAEYVPPPGFLSPEDFMSQQKKRSQNFYANGPGSNEIVEVNASSLDEVLNANVDRTNTSSESGSMPSQQAHDGRQPVKLFQFAAETASLSKSCSSDSVVSGSEEATGSRRKQIVHRLNTNKIGESSKLEVFPSINQSLPGSILDVSFSSQRSNAQVPQNKAYPPTSYRAQATPEKQSNPRVKPVSEERISLRNRSPFQHSNPASSYDTILPGQAGTKDFQQTNMQSVVFEPFNASLDAVPWPSNTTTEGNTSVVANSDKNLIFGDIEWSADFAYNNQEAQQQDSVAFSSETKDPRAEDIGLQQSTPLRFKSFHQQTRGEQQNPIQEPSQKKKSAVSFRYEDVHGSASGSKEEAAPTFAVAKSRFEAAENLFKQSKSLFEEKRNTPDKAMVEKSSTCKSALEEEKTPLKANGKNAPVIYRGGLGNKKIELHEIEPDRRLSSPWEKESSPFKIESPCKENEISDSAGVNKAKMSNYEKKMRITSPFAEREENVENPISRSRGAVGGSRSLTDRQNQNDSHSKIGGQVMSPTTAKMLDICSDVTSRYNGSSKKNKPSPFRGSSPQEVSKNNTYSKGPFSQDHRSSISSQAKLGAIPMTTPNAMHLFIDKTDSYDEQLTRSSSIDSYESNSTVTTATEYDNASPRGIRGSFPTLEYSSSSSQSASTISTNLVNDLERFKRARRDQMGSARRTNGRPPTAVPPTAILSSMLFQNAGEQESVNAVKTVSPKREKLRERMPCRVIRGNNYDDTSVSDITGSTASEWMIEGSRLLGNYYNNRGKGEEKKKHSSSRQTRTRKEEDLGRQHQEVVKGIHQGRQKIEQRKRIHNGTRDPLEKMHRHQHKFQYPDEDSEGRTVRSGFDNMNDDDTVSLFEA